MIAVFLLCAVFLNTAHAEDLSGTFPFETNIYTEEPQQSEFTYRYSDIWFSQSSYDWSENIAQLAIRLSMVGFGAGEDSSATNLLAFFDCLNIHYSDDTVHYVKPGPETIGFAYGTRDISDDEVLIVAVVRGGNYQQEWASNFTLGTSEDHEGFRTCADIVAGELEAFIREIPADKKVSLFMTGYSRGAAVCNLAAASLDDLAKESKLGALKPEDLYAYCMACPNTTSREERSDELYSNIFSVVHSADPVPRVVPGEWGYGRFGRTFVLPSTLTLERRKSHIVRVEIQEKFRKYTKTDFKIPSANDVTGSDGMIASAVDFLKSPQIYAMVAQGVLRNAILNENSGASAVSLYLGGESNDALSNVMRAHVPELYLAAIDDLKAMTEAYNQAHICYSYFVCESPNCEVRVFESDGNSVAEGNSGNGWNSLCVEEKPCGVYNVNSKKVRFSCSEMERFVATFTARGDRTITLTFGRYDSVAARDQKRIEYEKLQVSEGEVLVLAIKGGQAVLYRCGEDNVDAVKETLFRGETPEIEAVEPGKVFDRNSAEEPPQGVSVEAPTVTPEATISPAPEVGGEPEAKDRDKTDLLQKPKAGLNEMQRTILYVGIGICGCILAAAVVLILLRRRN